MTPFLLSTVATLLLLLPATCATIVGITYNPTAPNLPPPELVATTLHAHHISAVHILNPTPDSVRAFCGKNISLLLSLPNSLVSLFAYNRSTAYLWLVHHVLPFHLWTRISLISLGYVRPWPTIHILALRNLHQSLIEVGINTIPLSATFSFNSIASFPPSTAKFKDLESASLILEFLEQTNSPFLVNLYPYDIYMSRIHVTPIGFALFEVHRHNFRDDTGVRYWSLYEMMMASVKGALAASGHGNISVIVAETGWPSSNERDSNYAEMYLRRLITYLRRSEPGKQGEDAEVYIYQLFDDVNDDDRDIATEYGAIYNRQDGKSWGVMHPNMTMKYSGLVFGVEEDKVCGKPMNVVDHPFAFFTLCVLLGTFCVAVAYYFWMITSKKIK